MDVDLNVIIKGNGRLMKRTVDFKMPSHRSSERNQLITVGDRQDFKAELFQELEKNLPNKNDCTERQWLRSSEVLGMLRISPGTFQKLGINGTISFSKIGGIVFYKYEGIARLKSIYCKTEKKLLYKI